MNKLISRVNYKLVLLRGYSVLVVAAIANYLARLWDLLTWYDVFQMYPAVSWDPLSVLFLFLVYPGLLGGAYYLREVMGFAK